MKFNILSKVFENIGMTDDFTSIAATNGDAKKNKIQKYMYYAKLLMNNHVPGQLVIQYTDRCNATCPQCGMRVTEKFKRSTLSDDVVKKMIDAAASKNFSALSFTGGEPLLYLDRLIPLFKYAGEAGIEYIRTGTNGFVFKNSDAPDFEEKIKNMAGELSKTPLRNFWISIDSSVPEIHEAMRGLPGVISGIRKALPIFHEHGLFPSANLGINRNVGGSETYDLDIKDFHDENAYLKAFYDVFQNAFRSFYECVIDLGFTINNSCYPMSIDDGPEKADDDLSAVYAATSSDRVIRFSIKEKQVLFKALLDVIPEYRSKIRIFSPRSSLFALCRQYEAGTEFPFTCRGGIDFFFADAKTGDIFPCGYRGNESLGTMWDLTPKSPSDECYQCDWECFRDPAELIGPFTEVFNSPVALLRKMTRHPDYMGLWLKDVGYYVAADFFDGKKAPDFKKLKPYGIQ